MNEVLQWIGIVLAGLPVWGGAYYHFKPCRHEWELGSIPCPDNQPGCLVAHYGHRCIKCGATR